MNYKTAGVDIEAGKELVKNIKPIVDKTYKSGVMPGFGGFGGLFELPSGYQNPVLVSSTDGVGTKLKLSLQLGIYDTIGIDLVAMCANDVVVLGAEPLFFLDYYATSKLKVSIATAVLKGIGSGCGLAGVALIGGETAEMPGIYTGSDYDLAGFCVGIVEKNKLIDGSQVKSGDKLLGIASTGFHSNGYTLIRKIIESNQINLEYLISGESLGEILLKPTKIYVKSLLELLKTIPVHAISHITGGGITENLPRVLPDGLSALIDLQTWDMPETCKWIQKQGNISQANMLTTFNCGIGMIVCVDKTYEAEAIDILTDQGETVFVVGEVITAKKSAVIYSNK